mgnify:CR=1 FL=1
MEPQQQSAEVCVHSFWGIDGGLVGSDMCEEDEILAGLKRLQRSEFVAYVSTRVL